MLHCYAKAFFQQCHLLHCYPRRQNSLWNDTYLGWVVSKRKAHRQYRISNAYLPSVAGLVFIAWEVAVVEDVFHFVAAGQISGVAVRINQKLEVVAGFHIHFAEEQVEL